MRSKTARVNSPHHILCPEFCVRPNAPSKVTNADPISNLLKQQKIHHVNICFSNYCVCDTTNPIKYNGCTLSSYDE